MKPIRFFLWGIDKGGKQVAICERCHDWFMGYGPEVRTWTHDHTETPCGVEETDDASFQEAGQ